MKELLVAMDIETTGLSPFQARIIELGAVLFSRDSGIGTFSVIDTFNELICPEIPIPGQATAINGITDTMVAGKRRIEEALPDFVKFCGNAYPLAHNTPFDLGFILYDLSRLGIRTTSRSACDTLKMVRRAFPGMRSYALPSLTASLKIGRGNQHRALDDSFLCMQLFQKCLQRVAEHPAPELDLRALIEAYNPLGLSLSYPDIFKNFGLKVICTAMESRTSVNIKYYGNNGNPAAYSILPRALFVDEACLKLEASYGRKIDYFELNRISI